MFMVIDENIDIHFMPDKFNVFSIKNYNFSDTNIEFLKLLKTLNIKENKNNIKQIYEDDIEFFFTLKSIITLCYANFFVHNIIERDVKEALKFLKNILKNNEKIFQKPHNTMQYKFFSNLILTSTVYTRYNIECCFNSNLETINYENEVRSIFLNSKKIFYKNNELISTSSKKYIFEWLIKGSKKEFNFISFIYFCYYMYYFYINGENEVKDYIKNINIINFDLNENSYKIKSVFNITKIFDIFEKNNFFNKKTTNVLFNLKNGNTIYENDKKFFLYARNFFNSIDFILKNNLLKENNENFMFYSFNKKSSEEQRIIINELFKNLSKKSKKTIQPTQSNSFENSFYVTILKNNVDINDIMIIMNLLGHDKINFHDILSKKDLYDIIKTINNIKELEYHEK